MRRIRPPVASALLGLAVVTASGAAVPAIGSVPRPAPLPVVGPALRPAATRSVAPGITYTRLREPAGPWIVHVLRVDLPGAPTLDVTTAAARMGRYARTSVMGSTRGAVAAVNGDFSVAPGRPLHTFARDGTLMAAGLQNGANFGISQDELSRYVSNDRLSVSGRNLTTGTSFEVSDWNRGDPARDEVAAFTRYGGQAERPPDTGCAVRLRPDGGPRWGDAGEGVRRDYVVEAARCAADPMWVQPRTVVLASRRWGIGGDVLETMDRGQRVRLTWSLGWAGIMDSIGGMPLVVKDGRNAATMCASSFCRRNPRTAMAVTDDGALLLVVVDGRKRSSVGMTLPQLGRYLVGLGALHAINLDGGGSSTMWIRGDGVVNDPSDGTGERPVSNAVLVLDGPDVDEPIPGSPLGSPDLAGAGATGFLAVDSATVDAARATRLASIDPGSTGGLADAMLAGDLGWGRAVPRPLVRAARLFRAVPS